ncbi:MAG: hypothetical protein [Bacteriophage sp.]|nr:MAG: hypothetical protein [Bacteriophage sp.]
MNNKCILLLCGFLIPVAAQAQVLKENDPSFRICKLAVERLIDVKSQARALMMPTYSESAIAMDKAKEEDHTPPELQLTEVGKDHITYGQMIRGYVADWYTCRFQKNLDGKLILHPFGVEQNLSRIDKTIIALAGAKKYDKTVSSDILHSNYISVINDFNDVLLAVGTMRYIEPYLYEKGGYPIDPKTTDIEPSWPRYPSLDVLNRN